MQFISAGPSNHNSASRQELSSFRNRVMSTKSDSSTSVTPKLIVEKDLDTFTFSSSAILPSCSLNAAFVDSDTNDPVPPAFYPGQTIPTLLSFTLNRYSSLPHSYHPTLSMSLVGSLHIPNEPSRTIICVSVSLAEGLELWARDAKNTYAKRTDQCPVDTDKCLPGGMYSLPLTVQVPLTPRLPPSFTIPRASFSVTYELTVTLAIDDPLRPGSRINLAEASRPFEMLPETLPTRAPRYTETSFSVRQMKMSPRWTVTPYLPTTTFSPTSVIPITIRLSPLGWSPLYHVLVRIALTRREHSSTNGTEIQGASGLAGLVKEEEILSTAAWFQLAESRDISTVLPIMPDGTWPHGFSTMLNVSTSESPNPIAVLSTFHISTTLAFLPQEPGSGTMATFLPQLPGPGEWTKPSSKPIVDMRAFRQKFPGIVRTLPLPIIIGSVSEPRLAMYSIRWSDLHLDQMGQGRMIEGESISCEDGWIQEPPSYREAICTAPYDF